MTLTELYFKNKSTYSDIYEHLATLLKYSLECDHITEFGTRTGISTSAFLFSLPKTLICYDICRHSEVYELERLAKENCIDFRFKLNNTLEAEIKETDLLFIDTLHTYGQLKQELKLHGNKARKYLIFHDTETFGSTGMDGLRPGLNLAIAEFLNENKHWEVDKIYYNNNGLTVLKRS
jgi:hypothetical protein